MSDPSSLESCRADVWLWRARFFKTRADAAKFIESGKVRLTRPGASETRLDKGARSLRPGDRLVFALGARLVAIRIKAAGARRGPASEAQGLYEPLLTPGQESSGEV